MGTCQHCGSPSDFPYTCNYCGMKLCSDCRLPEKHACVGLRVEDMPNRSTSRTGRTAKGRPRSSQRASTSSGRWLLVLVGAVLFVGLAAPMLDSPQPTELAGANATVTHPPTATPTPELADDLDTVAVATAIHEEVNRVRQEHNRIGLAHEGRLQTAARRHSEVMAREGAIFHEGPDGDLQDRLERAGYDCRVPVSDGRYSTGGENVAKTWYQVSLTNGEHYTTADELARGIVEQWMDSPGHRENILANHWQRHGAGIAVVQEPEGLAVYATQIFC